MLGDTVEGIFVLDDIVGFINEEHYQEFAHPYLKRICDAFPKDWVKLYHNDAEVDACLDHLPDAGFNVLNWGKQKHISEVKERVGDRMCLMGNVNPLEVGVRGTPEEVKEATLEVLEAGTAGDGKGMILSVGGGTSPGMPRREHRRDARSARAVQRQAAGAGLRVAWASRPCLSKRSMGETPMLRSSTMPDYALMNQYLYEGKAKEVEQMTKDALAEGRHFPGSAHRRADRRHERRRRGLQAQHPLRPRGAHRRPRDEGGHGRAQAAAQRQGQRHQAASARC